MMPQFNDEGSVSGQGVEVVISICELNTLVAKGLLSFDACKGDLFHYKLVGKLEEMYKELPNTLRYLDRFLIILPTPIKEQQLFWERFYSLYSTEYLYIVDIEHNLSCIRYFKNLLNQCSVLYPQFKLLDFGCGPGLSLDVFGPEHLVGYDNSPKMLAQAKARGLEVLSKKEFDRLPPCSFDGVIACYVLHLAIPEDDIMKLARVIKVGGILVANYYKNIGVERVSLILGHFGFSAQKVSNQERRFGSVYIYRKQPLFSPIG